MTKNIAYITNASPASGVGHRAFKIREALQRQNTVTGLREFRLDGIACTITRDHEKIHTTRSLPHPLNAKSLTWIRQGRWLRRYLKNQDFALWHATNQSISFILSPDAPSIVTVHDLIETEQPQTVAGGLLARYLYHGISHASHVITVSAYTARTVAAAYNIPPDRLTTIPNGVDPKEFYPIPNFSETIAAHTLRRRLHTEPSNKVVLYVGSDHPRKNVVGAVQAFAAVHQRRPDTVFVKIGDPGIASGRARLLAEIDHLNLRDHIRLIGQVSLDELNEIYNFADVLLYPSHFEGFGLPPLQAMAAGTPVVTCNATSLPEVVGNAALQRDPDDTAGLAEDIVEILSDESVQVKLRTAGLARAALFSWETAARAEHAVYKKLNSSL